MDKSDLGHFHPSSAYFVAVIYNKAIEKYP